MDGQEYCLFILPYIIVVGIFQFISASILDVILIKNSIKTTFQHFIISFFWTCGLCVLWLFYEICLDYEKIYKFRFHLKNKSKHFI
jgi:hypothetical protein